MFWKRTLQLAVPVIVLVLILAACDLPIPTITFQQPEDTATLDTPANTEVVSNLPADAAAQATAPPIQPASLPAGPPTATPFTYQGPPPAAGTGGVYGRLLWDGKPVEGVQVKLCEEIKMFGGCQGTEYPAVTDSYGVYAILNVPPRKYGLTYKALDAEKWYYVTSGFLNSKEFEITAGEMVNVGDHHTIRLDLVVLSPQKDDRLTIPRPTISWEAYPGASYYELTFHSGRGDSLVHRKKITTTSYTLEKDLQSCDYSFDIEAFNSQGILIAENDGWTRFKVGGMPQSCELVILTPAKGATLPSSGITLTWQPHDWASTYKLHFYSASDSKVKILDFVETRETSYTITQAVPAGEYTWVVYAYDAFGDGLGFSDTYNLYVTNP